MKRILLIAALGAATLLPRTADAQVEKQVEVTKEYVPQLQQAAKLPVAPDMTDTTRMRPEITYTVTPLSLSSALEVQPIRPATVTYWSFNRPLPFYLKVGAGYPLNSVLDFYAATQHPDTGYALAYINHAGRYADLRNCLGVENRATQMLNRAGVAAGKYIGRHVLEANLSYENRLYHRYGAYAAASAAELLPAAPGSRIDYGDAALTVRIGDDFEDLSRLNFDVSVGGNLFYDQSVWPLTEERPRQLNLFAAGKLAKAFGRHQLALEAGYERLNGRRALADYAEDLIHAALRYGTEGRTIRFEAGIDYYYDRPKTDDNQHYIAPFLRFDLNLGTRAIRPFLEIDGALQENSYRALTRECPYVVPETWAPQSSMNYNARLGLRGDLWRDRFAYRLYAALSVRDNHNYWYAIGQCNSAEQEITAIYGVLGFLQARQTVTSFHGEAEFRPASALVFDLGLHGYLYHDDPDLCNGSPAFEGRFGARYTVKQVTFGLALRGRTARKWTTFCFSEQGAQEWQTIFTDSASLDLNFSIDWRVSGRFAIFAEGNNLLNQQRHSFPWYPDYGARFTAGIKLAF